MDGKERNVSKRRYCIDCSPFGQHNTSQIHLPSYMEIGKKVCPRCGKEKDIAEFHLRRNGTDVSSYCKTCVNDETIERQTKFKRKCVEYKGGKCEMCGYNRCYAALDFHHRDPSQKDFGISKAKLTSFCEKVERELDKCMLVCANCHRELHVGFKCSPSEMDIIKPCEGLVPGSNPGVSATFMALSSIG